MQINTSPVTLSLAPAQNPLVLNDISNAAMYAHGVKKRKLQDTTAITDDDVSNAALEEYHRIAQFAGTATNAPPWFGAFAGTLEGIERRLDGIERRLDGIERRQFNGTATAVGDEIRPPQRGDNPAPANFPVTVQALRDLQIGPLLTEIENYYALNHGGAIAARISRIRRIYGIGVITSQGGPHILEF
jgi:hypothetical protein